MSHQPWVLQKPGANPWVGSSWKKIQVLWNLCHLSSFNPSEKFVNCDSSTLQARSTLHHEPRGRGDDVTSEYWDNWQHEDYAPSLWSQGADLDAFYGTQRTHRVTNPSSGIPEM